MPTLLDNKILPKVQSVLSRFGKILTYRTYPSATTDFVTNEVVPGSSTDYSILSIPPYNFEKKLVDGKTVRDDDLLTGFAGKDAPFVPTPNNTSVIVDGIDYTIVSVEAIYSGEMIALYMLHLRQ